MSLPFIIIMGVSGCGKTTIASQLADSLDGIYLEGDSFHSPENKAKMAGGTPLTDEDRWPWFDSMIAAAHDALESGKTPVLSCSALKQIYRDYLGEPFGSMRLVYLKGSFELIKSRMDARDHEYMTSDLLKSQFETLEEPSAADDTLTISIEETPEEILAAIQRWIG